MYVTNESFRSMDMDTYVNINNLSNRGDLQVIRIFKESVDPKTKEKRPYILNVIISYKNKFLTERYVDMVYIRKYLKLFTNKHLVSDEPNDFFKLNTEKGIPTRIQCKFDEERFIYRAEADTILEGLNSALEYYSRKYFDDGTNSVDVLAYVDSLQSEENIQLKTEIRNFVNELRKKQNRQEGE